MSDRPVFTYQTRPALDSGQVAVLDAYAELYGRAERSLFAAMQAGGKLNDLKRDFLPRFGITSRQFNALRIGLDGKIDSIKQRRPDLIVEAQTKIKKAAKVIARLTTKTSRPDKLHQKKRRLGMLQARLCNMQGDQASGKVLVCALAPRNCFMPSSTLRPMATRRTRNGGTTGLWIAPASSLYWAARMN